ncbi:MULTISPECIES: response regulator [Olivibacter]|uniref:Response regulator receiver protein n=3 Tax=Sphingobacteriaceae TaxID=84566 RepID=F4C3Y0_SPHS2|nr:MULTISPECIES: response regulator [Olivibacter]MCL4638829.1 response regulator [Olivibacter sp. UJ_SKK_5.1]MDM8175053.1 response regulator [Olivibacter sp. 47]MDX3913260.1 response regulator [Pseudosphingobacterium sp.]QEL01834.1 response regulator [Olivibacter sp. LS-1]
MRNKILILDDDEDILYFCSVVFENLDFEVISSPHSKDIIEQVEKANPDIILIDNWIPGLGGVKGTQTLKATSHLKDIPVIIFSANSNLPTLAEEAGADSYLRKPFDLDELENLALSLLQKKA